jgi:hypothetical protein
MEVKCEEKCFAWIEKRQNEHAKIQKKLKYRIFFQFQLFAELPCSTQGSGIQAKEGRKRTRDGTSSPSNPFK